MEQQSARWRAAREALAANVVSGALTLSVLRARLDILESVADGLRRDEAEAVRRQALGAAPRAAVLDARRQSEAVAAQIPCKHCIYFHTKAARQNGATDAEIQEALAIAALTRHWSTFLNGTLTSEATFRKEVDQIVATAKRRRQTASR